jgi:arylsulfatase
VKKAQERPHIVLVLVDDMGFSDIGSYGSEIHTPHLDSLAEDGVRFILGPLTPT